jgi:hypothetical protein
MRPWGLSYLRAPISIAPLVSFRIVFGTMMLASTLRFIIYGWVDDLYLVPRFFFSYYGFEWVQPLEAVGMYGLFALMLVSALGILLGAFYRISAAVFFLSFTYVELIDKTNYLNHYYFVSIVAALLVFLPAHRAWSVDVWRRPGLALATVPRWMVGSLRLQLGMVYVFAGIAKLNTDWLLRAQPMRIWLPAKTDILGGWLAQKWVAYAFSWAGTVYDLGIPFFLLWRRTRTLAYLAVIAFHLLTWLLFPIGMFPWIMILSTLVFFPGEWHERRLAQLRGCLRIGVRTPSEPAAKVHYAAPAWLLGLLGLHFVVQVLLPFRYLAYPGKLFWTEEGYRFSWRVMLMEKAGHATFRIRDPRTGAEGEVINSDHLTPLQEKMMSSQPDMLLQYAHYLDTVYQRQGIPDPEVYADVYVTLNGSGTRPFIDPTRDLSRIRESFAHKDWILPFPAPQPVQP